MNTRIQELAEQANYLATEKEFPYDEDWFYLYNKRFSELLINESIKVMMANDYHGEWLGEKLKEHFEIE